MEMRDILAVLSMKHNGELLEILRALDRNEQVTPDEIQKFKENVKYKYVTVIDDNYPELFKRISAPPIVLFYKGNLDLINDDNRVIAKATDQGVRMFHAIEPVLTSKGIGVDYVMSSECHDDMDMLMEKMSNIHEQLEACGAITHERKAELHRNVH